MSFRVNFAGLLSLPPSELFDKKKHIGNFSAWFPNEIRNEKLRYEQNFLGGSLAFGES